MQHLTRTRRRKAATITAALFLLIVGSAFAYYIFVFTGAGSGSAKLGESGQSAVLALSAKLPEGLKPGESGVVTFTASNPTGETTSLHHLIYDTNYGSPSIDSAHEKAGCSPSWFHLTNNSGSLQGITGVSSGSVTIPGGGEVVTLGTSELAFEELSGTNQSACSGATITISLSST